MPKEKKEKKNKTETDTPGITKKPKKEKKDKKDKKDKKSDDTGVALVESIANSYDDALPTTLPPTDHLFVPFAEPLADEKQTKKLLKTVKKAAKSKSLKRGVKEVVKALRKSPTGAAMGANGVVILAADISPMDVISHVPVLCEDHSIPYIFVSSRAELGVAAGTKRPTSLAMMVPGMAKKEEEGFAEAYDEIVKLVAVATREVGRKR